MRKPGLVGSCWPDQFQEGLLRAATLEPERAVLAWAQVRSQLDLDRLEDFEATRLLPLVSRKLMAGGATDPDLQRLQGLRRRWWVMNQTIVHHAVPAMRALSDAGIKPLVLKGLPLALRYYKDLAVRPMVDVDVLVPREQADAAFDALEGQGWRTTHDQPRNRMFAARHSENLAHADGGAIDLHWVSSPLFAVGGDDQSADNALRKHSQPLAVGEDTVLMPAPADLLLHVIAHGCWIGSKATVRWAADAATVIAVTGGEMSWDYIVDFACSHRLVPQVRDALTYLSTALDVPVPSTTLDDLRSQRVSARDRRVYRGLSGDTHAPAILGALPLTRARWLYRSAGWTRWHAAQELPDFLRETWGLRDARSVPLEAARKGIRKLRGGSSSRRPA